MDSIRENPQVTANGLRNVGKSFTNVIAKDILCPVVPRCAVLVLRAAHTKQTVQNEAGRQGRVLYSYV